MKLLRNPTAWGAGALVLATVVSLVAAWLYISPPGQKMVTFYTDDAASVHSGDVVRIAGINVGKVSDLSLEPDRVRVRAKVDGHAFVGDQSQVEVRMLTVVGGYYVNLVSLGDKPLGSEPIPLARVKMPYNLMTALADTTKLTDNLQGNPLKQTLDQLQKGLTGDNVEAISSLIDAGNSLVSTIQKQRGQLTEILKFSNEYVSALNGYRDGIRVLVRKISIAIQTLVIYGKKFGDGITAFADVLGQLSPIAYFYRDHRADFMEKVRHYLETARMWAEHNGAVIRSLRLIENKFQRVFDAENAPPDLLATDLCMPMPGSPC
ncbi:mammalian cell entry protein [Mycobacterium paraffinicum]|uniref:Mammalian cell entry protein n=1 Tax=Mycobacterium paraffinicum TaxID=53378 RepID=A0A1Q4I387_9MYCO|nr:mammalian cell entry protein [Mycobacterium paraffinicum]